MSRNSDLGVLDRGTLVLWRASNLLGWGIAAVLAHSACWIVVTMLVVRPTASSGLTPLLVVVAFFLTGVIAAAVAGVVAGDHVYRWPAAVSMVAVAVPAMLAGLLLAADPASVPTAALLVTVEFAVAGIVGRRRWNRRPRALRFPSQN